MIRRIIAIALVVLGLAGIAGAIGSATVWKPDEIVTLELPTTPDVPFVTTAPGALTAVNDAVEVTVVAAEPTDPVVLALGRTDDVNAWVGEAPHWTITGLTDWQHLSYEAEEGTEGTEGPEDAGPTDEPTEEPTDEATEEPSPDAAAESANPAGSDLWIDQVEGEGELHYTWAKVPGRWSMLVAGDGSGPAPQVQLTWEREVPTPFLVPGIIGGAVLLLIGLALLAADLLARREARRTGGADTYEPELTAELQAIDPNRPLTRRELREAERARGGRAAQRRGDTTEVLPVIADAPEPGSDEAAAELAAWAGGSVRAPEPADPMPAAGDPAAGVHAADLIIPAFLRPSADRPAPAGAPGSTPGPGEGPGEGTETIPVVTTGPTASAASATGTGTDTTAEPAIAPAEQAATETAAAGEDDSRPRRRWWRRRRPAAGAQGEAGATEPVQPDGPAPSPLPEEPATDDASPQVSGASWRATWGMGAAASEARPQESDDPTAPDDQPDEREEER